MKTLIAQGAIFSLMAFGGMVRSAELPFYPKTYEKGHGYLVSVQRTDGSWGSETGCVYTTGIAVLAFLNLGEGPASSTVGANVERGLRWLMRQSPTGDMDRVCLVHALTAAYNILGVPVLQAEASRVRDLIVPTQLQGLSKVLFDITLPAKSLPTDRDQARTNGTLQRVLAEPEDIGPMRRYLEAIVLYAEGGPTWEVHFRATLSALAEAQREDGSIPYPGVKDPVEATILALLELSVPSRYWLYYVNDDWMGYPKSEEPMRRELEALRKECTALEAQYFPPKGTPMADVVAWYGPGVRRNPLKGPPWWEFTPFPSSAVIHVRFDDNENVVWSGRLLGVQNPGYRGDIEGTLERARERVEDLRRISYAFEQQGISGWTQRRMDDKAGIRVKPSN